MSGAKRPPPVRLSYRVGPAVARYSVTTWAGEEGRVMAYKLQRPGSFLDNGDIMRAFPNAFDPTRTGKAR
jgi:hypothetical protein